MPIPHVALEADLLDLVARTGGTPPRSPDATLASLGLGSAELLEIVAEVEDRHQIVVRLDELGRLRTFGQLVAHLAALVEARA